MNLQSGQNGEVKENNETATQFKIHPKSTENLKKYDNSSILRTGHNVATLFIVFLLSTSNLSTMWGHEVR